MASIKDLQKNTVRKLKDGTLTIGEAIEYVSNPSTPIPEQYSDADKIRKKMNTLRNNIVKLSELEPEKFPLGIDTPLKDMRDPEIVLLFRKETSPTKANNAYNYQRFENVFFDNSNMGRFGIAGFTEEISEGIEETMYPRLAGAGNPMGTQRTGMAGERPMRGMITKEELDTIYSEALPEIEAEYGTKVSRLIDYHRNTFQRPEQLLNLKKSDVIVVGDTITIKGKEKTEIDHKGRPELKFKKDSRMGGILFAALNESDSDLLFDISPTDFNEAFNKSVGSRLEPFSDKLPLAEVKITDSSGRVIRLENAPVTTPGAIRSIVPHYMIKEMRVGRDFVLGLMGHVNGDVLESNYTGVIANEELPNVIDNPENFRKTGFGSGSNANLSFDRSLLTEEQIQQLADEYVETESAELKARGATASRITEEEGVRKQEAISKRAAGLDKEVEESIKIADAEAKIAEAKASAKANLKADKQAKKGADYMDTFIDIATKGKGPVIKGVAAGLASVPVLGAPFAGISEAAIARRQGADMPEALVRGAAEFAPVTPSDLKMGEEAIGAVGSQMQEMMERPSQANPQGLSIMDQMRSMLGQGGGFNFN